MVLGCRLELHRAKKGILKRLINCKGGQVSGYELSSTKNKLDHGIVFEYTPNHGCHSGKRGGIKIVVQKRYGEHVTRCESANGTRVLSGTFLNTLGTPSLFIN